MKKAVILLLLLLGCSWRERAQPMQKDGPLPAALVKQILEDQYSGRLPGRVLIDVQDWKHHSWDLNEDGSPDFVIEQEDPSFCGSGGCGTLIYLSTPKGFRCAYSGGCFYSDCTPLPFKTNGVQDLIFKNTTITEDAFYTVLWFDGHEYRDENPGRTTSD